MTSDEYADAVRQTILSARDAMVKDENYDQLAWAYTELANGASKRCRTNGRIEYEIDSDTQRFENETVFDAIIECRSEAFDVPAYLTQVALLEGWHNDPDVREGIDHAARLVLILDRLVHRISNG
jgi:hypothetical protein